MSPEGMITYEKIAISDFYRRDDPAVVIERWEQEPKITGFKGHLTIIDDLFDWPAPIQMEPKGPPMKQNGRSAAYLAHDPTKRHRRQKRIRS